MVRADPPQARIVIPGVCMTSLKKVQSVDSGMCRLDANPSNYAKPASRAPALELADEALDHVEDFAPNRMRGLFSESSPLMQTPKPVLLEEAPAILKEAPPAILKDAPPAILKEAPPAILKDAPPAILKEAPKPRVQVTHDEVTTITRAIGEETGARLGAADLARAGGKMLVVGSVILQATQDTPKADGATVIDVMDQHAGEGELEYFGTLLLNKLGLDVPVAPKPWRHE